MSKLNKLKLRGILMLAAFTAVLVVLFLPVFPGFHGQKTNGLNYLDNFFNQLSKGSAYYIGDQLQAAGEYKGKPYSATIKFKSPEQATLVKDMLVSNDIQATTEEMRLIITDDFGTLMTIMLNDADLLYKNDGNSLQQKYGQTGPAVIYTWYQAMALIEAELNKTGNFAQAKFVKKSMTKALEPAYNYYTVEAKPVKEAVMLLIFSLVFYVLYTVWYGFGLLFIFEGIGIKLAH